MHVCKRSALRIHLAKSIAFLLTMLCNAFSVNADEFAELVAASGVPSDEIPELLETLHKWGLLLYFPRLGGLGELVAYVHLMLLVAFFVLSSISTMKLLLCTVLTSTT